MHRGWASSFPYKLMVLLALVLPTAASAGELGDFHQLVAKAYAPYRSAMFYLRTGNPGVAALEISAAGDHWQAVVDRFAKHPPDAVADDPMFRDSLMSVASALDAGREAIDADDIDHAREVLATVRADLSELRRRNGLWLFSDCVDEMNAAMDRLWVFRHEPPAFGEIDQVNAVKREAAITGFLYRRCYDAAPIDLKASGEFERLFEGSLQSLPLIFEALDQASEARLINILRELRSFDRMIWLQYG